MSETAEQQTGSTGMPATQPPANVDDSNTVAPPPIAEAQADGAPPDNGSEGPDKLAADAGDASASVEAAEAGDEDKAAAAEPAPRKPRPKGAHLYRAFRSKRPVEGRIDAVIKGGYEVRVGKARGFCPHSQIDLHRVDDPESRIGQTYRFRIMQLRRGGEDVVLSRRALLEDQRKEEAAAVRATLIEGAVMQGRVAGTADFGAFVDLGAGVMGLVHITELSHGRVTRVDQAVKTGDTVAVKVLKIDETKKRISLSMRQAADDPWKDITERFEAGKIYPGKVTRFADFGAFVEIAPGVEALAPVRELPPSPTGWKERFERGEQEQWLVLSVDRKRRRVSVIPPVEGFGAPAGPPGAGDTLRGKVQRHERFGVFVWLGPGCVGLMPNAWSGVPRGQDLSRRLPIGEEIEVEVVEVAEKGRIRLKRKGLDTKPAPARKAPDPKPRHRSKARTHVKGASRPAAAAATATAGEGSFGSILGDKLKAALGQTEKTSR